MAQNLKAEKLIIFINTPSVLDSGRNVLIGLSNVAVSKFVEQGVISGGMLPKVCAAQGAVSTGVNTAHIIDGRIDHTVLLEIFNDQGIGTLISSDKI